jgi:hypothetical protein
MSKIRRIKKLLTARQLPHCYGTVRKIKRQTRIANKQRNESKR